MTRTVRQTNIKPDRPQDGEPRPFADFGTARNLVLLGDPGAGKTHVFKEAAAAEGSRFIKARAFLSMPASMLAGQSLFIDGLDEKRAGRSDRDTVDALVTKLFEVNPAKVRISCRVADWLGASDLAALQPYFEQHGDTPVLVLQSLSHMEQVAVLAAQGAGDAEADAFLTEATERGLSDFLENPHNLLMLWKAVKAGSEWPSTRKDLFEVSTKLLLAEFDEERARSRNGSLSVAELRPVAGAVCAARLISDVEAVSLTDQEGTDDIPGYPPSNSSHPNRYKPPWDAASSIRDKSSRRLTMRIAPRRSSLRLNSSPHRSARVCPSVASRPLWASMGIRRLSCGASTPGSRFTCRSKPTR
jgi:predicted NACHT family NTPase